MKTYAVKKRLRRKISRDRFLNSLQTVPSRAEENSRRRERLVFFRRAALKYEFKPKKSIKIKSFYGFSVKTVDRVSVFGYTDSKEAIP